MCRHLAWLGEPRSVASLVLDPPYGLLVQSYAPRRQKHGLMNADGWGVGFFDDDGAPRRWRCAAPLWGDASFASVAPVLRSGCVVAAVRSASVGMPIEASASAPFSDGRWLLSHNGLVDRAVLPASTAAESACDCALLAALIFDRGLDELGDTIAEVAAADPNARLNMLAGNGSQLRPPRGVTRCSCCGEPTAWCWPVNPSTTTRTGTTYPTATSSRSRLPRGADRAERIGMTVSLSNHLAADSAAQALRRDVRDGLTQTPKTLPPKWFYDAGGSELFDQITRLPEYYPTRAEAQILATARREIAAASGADTLVELGSGTSEKTRLLLSALRDTGSLRRFVPFDVDAGVLEAASAAILDEYPGIEIDAVCRRLRGTPRQDPSRRHGGWWRSSAPRSAT